MKFHNVLDAQKFLIEIGKLNEAMTVDSVYEPTNEEISAFISIRSPLVSKIKDHRQASASKANWRQNRYKIMRGIKSFHSSVEGKRFHRKLGRFLATRITREKATNESVFEMHEALVGLNSLRQHLIVELGYFHNLYEQIEVEELVVDYAVPMLSSIETKVLKGEELDSDEWSFLMDMVSKNHLVSALSELTGESFENLNNMYDTIISDLEKNGIKKENPEYYDYLVKSLIKSCHETKNV